MEVVINRTRRRDKPLLLLVDDDNELLRSLRLILSRLYAVRACSSALEAVQAVQQEAPDVVILDVRMPQHDGFWALRQIRTVDSDVPIIVNSAYQDAMPNDEANAAYRPFAWITKDGSMKPLVHAIEGALQQGGWIR